MGGKSFLLSAFTAASVFAWAPSCCERRVFAPGDGGAACAGNCSTSSGPYETFAGFSISSAPPSGPFSFRDSITISHELEQSCRACHHVLGRQLLVQFERVARNRTLLCNSKLREYGIPRRGQLWWLVRLCLISCTTLGTRSMRARKQTTRSRPIPAAQSDIILSGVPGSQPEQRRCRAQQRSFNSTPAPSPCPLDRAGTLDLGDGSLGSRGSVWSPRAALNGSLCLNLCSRLRREAAGTRRPFFEVPSRCTGRSKTCRRTVARIYVRRRISVVAAPHADRAGPQPQAAILRAIESVGTAVARGCGRRRSSSASRLQSRSSSSSATRG